MLLHELAAAFAPWGAATGITFVRGGAAAVADLTIRWDERVKTNDFLFDGPGGALAVATASTITFDAAERWELRSAPHPHRGVLDWDEMYFQLLPVAMHEIGHVLGLGHSDMPEDVMSPYYGKTRTVLSQNDIARAQSIVGYV